MGIKFFYNISIADRDDMRLDGDILSAVRRSYFNDFDKIRDRITIDSGGEYLLYDYCIEKEKPLRWSVTDADGAVVQDTSPAEGGRYYLNYYRDQKLFKRLLFSRLHTLLKVEYTDGSGAVDCSVEPRKLKDGLCLLYRSSAIPEPIVLSEMPSSGDERLSSLIADGFTDYTAAASTNDGVLYYLSASQLGSYKSFVSELQRKLESAREESFVGDNTPLYDKINVKDFNIKRNLSSALDITEARDFADTGAASAESAAEITASSETAEAGEPKDIGPESSAQSFASESEPLAEAVESGNEPAAESTGEDEASENKNEASDEKEAPKPDKLIMADGAVYSYFGELDEGGLRSGYGRTVTDLGRTAYEGMYLGDKRSGKGSYFYKDGTLCYSGDWLENARHGFGVGRSARDGSMHIGRWKNNLPVGSGVRVSADGEAIFVCKELPGGETVLMDYTEDGSVVISKYDLEGRKISEKKVSLTE